MLGGRSSGRALRGSVSVGDGAPDDLCDRVTSLSHGCRLVSEAHDHNHSGHGSDCASSIDTTKPAEGGVASALCIAHGHECPLGR